MRLQSVGSATRALRDGDARDVAWAVDARDAHVPSAIAHAPRHMLRSATTNAAPGGQAGAVPLNCCASQLCFAAV